MNTMKYANRLSFLSLCFIILSMLLFGALGCESKVAENDTEQQKPVMEDVANDKKYDDYLKPLDETVVQKMLSDMATYVLRKPDAATWQTKFNPEFREYFENISRELEWIYAFEREDTVYYFLIRDGRDHNGKSNRGVGGKMIIDDAHEIQYFEELFVTKIIDRINLEALGKRFMQTIENGENAAVFVQDPNSTVEWPDGRLFYSVEKSEWRYVD